jgi:hypothetical protein
MQRCLDCNGVLTTTEKVCPLCGAGVTDASVTPGEVLARVGMVTFYSGVLAFLVARLAPEGTNFIAIISVCAVFVLVFMRKKIMAR